MVQIGSDGAISSLDDQLGRSGQIHQVGIGHLDDPDQGLGLFRFWGSRSTLLGGGKGDPVGCVQTHQTAPDPV